jgi:hypothetical protein
MDEAEEPGSGRLVSIVVGVVLIALVAIGAMWFEKIGPFTVKTWSAVFMTDSEVFFGHVQSVGSDVIDVTNVFYLQKTSTGNTTGSSTTSTASQLSVAGLVANQIQCPTDEVRLDRHNILYWQTLQDASYVVQTLNKLVTNPQPCFSPSAAPAASAPAASAPATSQSTPATT